MIEHKVIRMRTPEKSSCVCLALNEKRYGNQKVIIFIIFFWQILFSWRHCTFSKLSSQFKIKCILSSNSRLICKMNINSFFQRSYIKGKTYIYLLNITKSPCPLHLYVICFNLYFPLFHSILFRFTFFESSSFGMWWCGEKPRSKECEYPLV